MERLAQRDADAESDDERDRDDDAVARNAPSGPPALATIRPGVVILGHGA